MLPFLCRLSFIVLLSHSCTAIQLPWTGQAGSRRDDVDSGRHVEPPGTPQPVLLDPQQARTIRKMSIDEGEMFFPDYWTFHEADRPLAAEDAGGSNKDRDAMRLQNESLGLRRLQPAFALHKPHAADLRPALLDFIHHPRDASALVKRDLSCPSDTTPCAGIDRPNSCCSKGLTCQAITDSGSGDVGCCEDGDSCGEDVGDCAADQQKCPSDQGGGCCIAGYSCADVGCVAASTFTVTVNPTVTASPSRPPSSSSPSSNSSVSAAASTSVATSTEEGPTSTIRSTEAAPIAPVRATSGSVSETETTTGPTTTFTPSFCPTGFYACNAHYLGGCCRVGRDCSSTSCPAPPSSLALDSNGVTVGVAPVVTSRLGEDGCALGWFRCDGSGGGGCCPSGYACGTSCTATDVNIGGGVTGTATVAKDNNAVSLDTRRCVQQLVAFWFLASAMLYFI